MEKRTAIKERTRGNLIRAFWDCYEKKPLRELTVKNITQAAGYNRSTFYLYFDDMDDLLEQAEDELLARLKDISDEAIASYFSETATENVVRRLVNECGRELRAVLGPWGDLRFLERFKSLLHFSFSKMALGERETVLVSEFTSTVIVSASTYLTAHPDTDLTWAVHVLHAYMQGGVMGVSADGSCADPCSPQEKRPMQY